MYTEEQKKEIEWLEVLKGACCTSNNLQMKLKKMPKNKCPDSDQEVLMLKIDMNECIQRMRPFGRISEKMAGAILGVHLVFLSLEVEEKEMKTYGEMQKVVYDAHIQIDKEYYKHYSDKMGIVENPRK